MVSPAHHTRLDPAIWDTHKLTNILNSWVSQISSLRGLLSFPPDMENFELRPLNVLIGPNRSTWPRISLYWRNEKSRICIEEPELGLHPDAVALIAELLIEASSRMQLVVTTHSDALVSALTSQPDAIIACERPGAGTELRRLEPEIVSHWLGEYRLGDLWRMGELGANP